MAIEKHYHLRKYLNRIRPHLKDINNPKKSDLLKFQLTIATNFISSEGNDEEHLMHSKSDIMANDNFLSCLLKNNNLDWKNQ